MDPQAFDSLVATIYSACGTGTVGWDAALIALARSTGSQQAVLEVSDRHSSSVFRRAPLCAPEFGESYRAYWGSRFTLWRRSDHIPVGELFSIATITDVDKLHASDFYHEWWRPQGTGGDTLMTNLIADGRMTALLTVYRPHAAPNFSKAERNTFARAADHFRRAICIERRLQLAECRAAFAALPSDALAIDKHGYVIGGDEGALRRLHAAGLLAEGGSAGRLDAGSSALGRLLQRGSGEAVDEVTGLAITLVPAPASLCNLESIQIDRPASLMLVNSPSEAAAAASARLAESFNLTRAETTVALEVARGDGRAAVARRLGLSPATVRNHLSSIYDKTGVRRQAGLALLVTRENSTTAAAGGFLT